MKEELDERSSMELKIKEIVEQFQSEQSVDKRILLARQKIKLLYQIRAIDIKRYLEE